METIYLGHDNAVRLIFKENSTAIDTASLTKVSIQVNTCLEVLAVDKGTGVLRWGQAGYDTGEIRIMIGQSTKITAGTYKAPVTLFDATNTNGIVWGTVDLKIEKDPMGSTST